MNFKPFCLLVPLTLGMGAALAADDACYQKAQTQADLADCAAQALATADRELNALYGQMQQRLDYDEDGRAALTQAQRRWVAFRDAECAFATHQSTGGSINAMQVNDCRARVTQSRVVDFNNYLMCAVNATDEQARLLDCAVPRAE